MGFQFKNILSSPFWLASLSIATGSWVVATVSTIFASTDHFAAWEAAFLVIPIVATIFAVATDTIAACRLALFPFYGIGIVYATTTANAALYLPLAAQKALGVGLIVLSATLFAWIIVAGVDRLLASTGLTTGVAKRPMQPTMGTPQMTSRSAAVGQKMSAMSVTTTPQIAAVNQSTAVAPGTASTVRPATSESVTSSVISGKQDESGGTLTGVQVDVAPEAVYGYKALAMYSYTASVDDPNELSFGKGEMMDIVDNQGKWWQARKADGSIGIVPSNYMKLV